MTRNEYFRKYVKDHKIVCNCGGPQYGTDHSPDCTYVLAWDDAIDDYKYYVREIENSGKSLRV